MSESNAKRPNVVMIYMDDLAYGDLACHGNPYTHTPHLDKLYSQSTRLTRFCSAPVCTPARARLMTGRYPFRTRAIDTYCGRSMIDPAEYTLAQMLNDANYRTCNSGKWHLGDTYPNRSIDMGFEEALVHRGGGLGQPGNVGPCEYFDPQLVHNGKPFDSEGYCTDIFTDHACQFMQTHRDENFFVFLATNAPHVPLQIGDEWVERYLKMDIPEKFAQLYGMVENIDHNVGKVMAKLDELRLTDDTIVIYSSDHGPCMGANHEGQIRWNCNLRSQKGTVYDGGLRVPCFWKLPGKIAADRDFSQLTNPIDVMPTLATMCGGDLPTDRKIDGRDISLWLLGDREESDWPSRNVFIQWHRGNSPVRYRNFAVYADRYKLLRNQEEAFELFDMIDDPAESNDLAAEKNEIVEALCRAYDEWFDDVSTERGEDNYDPPAIVIGTEHENPTALTLQDRRVGDDETWDEKYEGHFVVQFAQTATYDIQVRFGLPKEVGDEAELTLTIGDRELTETVSSNARQTVFENIEVEAGDAIVSARLKADDFETDARYIIFGQKVEADVQS